MNRWFYSAVATIFVLCAAAFSFVNVPKAQITQIVPTVSSGTFAASAVGYLLVPPNPTRHAIRICNTGSTNAIWIWPLNATTATVTALVSDFILAPVASSVITCYTAPTGIVGAFGAQAPGATNGYYGASLAGTSVSVEEW